MDNVLKVLRKPALKGEKGEKQKKAEIMAEADKFFDWVEFSKRTLGLNWNRFSLDQRKEFVSLYKQLLRDTYIDRITAYTNEKVVFANTVPLGENNVEVRTEVVTQTGRVPIYYRVMNQNGQWKVYDVVIEGVSLIASYRSQFREVPHQPVTRGAARHAEKAGGGEIVGPRGDAGVPRGDMCALRELSGARSGCSRRGFFRQGSEGLHLPVIADGPGMGVVGIREDGDASRDGGRILPKETAIVGKDVAPLANPRSGEGPAAAGPRLSWSSTKKVN